MILTTTPTVDDKIIGRYLAVVSARCPAHIGAESYDKKLKEALDKMRETALHSGANAIIDIKFVPSDNKDNTAIYIYGTAVTLT